MRWSSILTTAAFAGSTTAQTTTYRDSQGRTFSGYTDRAGVRYGIAIPTSAAPGQSFDAILQITAPISIGWAGLAWGGGMTYNPLSIVWPNGNDVMISARMAFGYSVPPPYPATTHTLLSGSGANATHFTVTALCRGCTYWSVQGSDPESLNPNGENYLANAYSTVPVDYPEEEQTTFGIHQGTNHWYHDFALAKQAGFEQWAGSGGGGASTTTLTTRLTTTTTTTTDVQTTLTTTVTRTGSPPTSVTTTSNVAGPTQTGVVPLPAPSSCPGVSAWRSSFGVASGWRAVKIAGGLRTPRGIVLDSNGNLLVVQSGLGVTVHTFGSDGCLSGSRTLISNPALNHGISLTADGTKLYVSSMTTAFEYSYNAASQTVSGERTVVRAMNQGGHPSRTLLIPPQTPHLLVISLGSFDNLDHPTINPATGRAIVKVFDLRNVPSGGYTFNTQGYLLGYGLRNGVALAADGGNQVWEVENGADQFQRTVGGSSYDIHADNPSEELNYLGDPAVENRNWYGYPTCHSVYGASQFTDKAFRTGDQFVLTPNATFNDEDCARRGSVPPRLSFQAHSAPMDAAFDRATENMFITFHGSWNRPVATGYKVVQVAFRRGANGQYEPVEPATSMTAAKDIFWSQNEGSCTSSTCFRPCGITFDRAYSRLIVGSDRPSEGELFMLIKT
ncbi:hypothetical protein VDGE_09058 [Verticillium dahliae]|uniref:Uncharacterized protein n=1 Tax=Verticillium dahliae TaxID=27337 RepID=A0A444RPV9_VERDA|nr:hypothetical protein VDGE_09058 [Verticillium dahliae]